MKKLVLIVLTTAMSALAAGCEPERPVPTNRGVEGSYGDQVNTRLLEDGYAPVSAVSGIDNPRAMCAVLESILHPRPDADGYEPPAPSAEVTESAAVAYRRHC